MKSLQEIKRRDFIRKAAAGSAAAGLALHSKAFNIIGSYPVADQYNVAIMGVNGRGNALAQGFALQDKAVVRYICDVDKRAVAKTLDTVKKAGQKSSPRGINDFREALDDKDTDILAIAAPDHWHAPAALSGLQAGKHIYVEKPGSHNPAEGMMVSKAAAKYGRTVQMGNQRRSWPRVIEALDALQNGVIGNVYYARTWYSNSRASIGRGKQITVPSWLDYELWQGPAPRKPYIDNLIHYNWHWHWHWGTGELLNNGTHFIDLARLGLNVDYPVKVYSTGGRYHFNDDWETPDTQIATYDFPEGKTMSWEGRSCNRHGINTMGAGVSFHGTGGSLEINNNSYKLFDPDGKLIKEVEPTTNTVIDQSGPGFDLDKDHLKNFLECIDSKKVPNSHYPDSFKSVLLCHLGNISYRVGRSINIKPDDGTIIDDEEAIKLWSRNYEPGWEPGG